MSQEREKRDRVKVIEKEFIATTEKSIEDVFKKVMFELHRVQIAKVAQCFESNKNDLAKANACSNDAVKTYLKLEKRIDSYISSHEEGIQNCISSCQSNIYTPIIDCYETCFKNYIQLAKMPIQSLESAQIN